MFEPLPELSSDLEWMLQSGQASPAMLGEALIAEYYNSIYQFAWAYFGSPEKAQTAAREVFTRALISVYRYRSHHGLHVWLYGVALETFRRIRLRGNLKAAIPRPKRARSDRTGLEPVDLDAALWRALDELSERSRLYLVLRFLSGWEADEAAANLGRIFRQKENRVKSEQAEALRFLMVDLAQVGVPDERLEPAALAAWLAGSLKERWLAPHLTEEEQAALLAQVLEQAGKHGVRHRSVASFKEFAWTGIGIAVIFVLIVAISQLLPEPDGSARTGSSSSITGMPENAQLAPAPLHALPPVTPSPTPGNAVIYFVKPDETLASIAQLFGMSVEELASLNGLLPGDALAPMRGIYVLPRTLNQDSPTPVAPAPRVQPLLEHPDAGVIYSYLLLSEDLWHTLWGDAQVIQYGPPGYVGPPLTYRTQVWVSQPSQSIQLMGPVSSEADPRRVRL